jgi:hypothetical protein
MSDHDVSSARVVAAFVLAPLVIPLVSLMPFSRDDSTGGFSIAGLTTTLIFYALFSLPIAYVVEAVVGIPAWMVFRRYRIRSLLAFVGTGAFIGWLVYAMLIVGHAGNLSSDTLTQLFNPSANPWLPFCVVSASAAAFLFRTIVFYKSES